MKPKHLRGWLMIVALMLAASGADAKTRKGDKLLRDGKAAELKQDWDKALDLYTQAVNEDPSDPGYLIAMRRARFEAGQIHVNIGEKLRANGKTEEALAEFQKALVIDPSSSIAIQEYRRTKAMIDSPKQLGAKPEDRNLTPAERVKRETEERVASILSPPELKPITGVIPSLKMNNQPPRVLYETVGKLAGVNVVFDSQYAPPGRNFNVDLNNSSIDQAFDYLAVLTHTFWKPISSNTIFVTEDNVTKRRDYEDEVVKVFYVTNATSVQEFQEIATAIRTVAEIRRVFTYNAQKAMVVRGTLDQVELAEKLIHDLDKPKSEVIVDVIVMEANSARTRDLAATLASAGTAGLNVPIAFTPGGVQTTTSTPSTTPSTSTTPTTTTPTTTTTTTSSGNFTLARIAHLSTNDFSTTLPGALLQAMLSDTKTKIMNSPQVRASDGQKVSLKIGNRIPYATGSFQPGVGTVGVSPLVSTQFNYADVGVNLEITAQVHSTDELTLHVEVEVSSVQQYINLGGISQPVIGQRKSVGDLRLREGEVNILGGLSQTTDSKTLNGIPGLVDIPVLGRVFGSEHIDRERGELLIALIPHIVRTPDYTAENLRGIYAGSDQVVKLYYAPKMLEAPPAGGAPAPSPAPAATPQPAKPAPSPIPGNPRISFQPPSIQTSLGAVVTINVPLENASDVFSVSPIKIKFDPAQLRLNDIGPGDVFSRDGAQTTSVKDIRNDTGEATLTVSRLPGAPGVSSTGSIAILNFTAVGRGTSSVTITDLGLKNTQQLSIPATLSELPVTIQ
jgi:general secretion pathway protein D